MSNIRPILAFFIGFIFFSESSKWRNTFYDSTNRSKILDKMRKKMRKPQISMPDQVSFFTLSSFHKYFEQLHVGMLLTDSIKQISKIVTKYKQILYHYQISH